MGIGNQYSIPGNYAKNGCHGVISVLQTHLVLIKIFTENPATTDECWHIHVCGTFVYCRGGDSSHYIHALCAHCTRHFCVQTLSESDEIRLPCTWKVQSEWHNWQKCKCNILTHYQTTNFTLFRIERLCRRQFQI